MGNKAMSYRPLFKDGMWLQLSLAWAKMGMQMQICIYCAGK